MPRFYSGNQLDLLRSGQEYFPALLAAIESASQEIYLETYIYNNDDVGRKVADALIAATARGVTVRLTVDGFGSQNLVPALGARFKAAGVEVTVFRPERKFLGLTWNLSRQRMRRLHRKLAMVDRRIAFVGGINIIDDWVHQEDKRLDAPRFDFAVRVQGPLVGPISLAMLLQWRRLNWARFLAGDEGFSRNVAGWWRRANWRTPSDNGSVDAAFVRRDNVRNRSSIERSYLSAISRARRDILISNAYFFPGRRFRKALYRAAARGVRVRLLLQGLAEYPLQHRASSALYEDLLRAGIKVYEYQPSLLHAKVAVIDSDWATVGSSNLDPFSLLLAREANVIVRNHIFARQLEQALEQAMSEDAVAIEAQRMAHRPWYSRIYNWFAYGVLRLGVLLTGQSSRY